MGVSPKQVQLYRQPEAKGAAGAFTGTKVLANKAVAVGGPAPSFASAFTGTQVLAHKAVAVGGTCSLLCLWLRTKRYQRRCTP